MKLNKVLSRLTKIAEMSAVTGIQGHDILYTVSKMRLLKMWKGGRGGFKV